MDNSVFFDLHLRDYNVATSLKNIGGTSHSVFSGMDNDINRTQRSMDELGRPAHINIDTSSIKHAHGQLEGLQEKMHQIGEMKLIGGFALGELVARGAEKGIDFAKEQVRDVLTAGSDVGLLKMKFKVLAGDEQGEKLFQDIHDYIPKSIFGPQLNQEAAVLLGMGESVKNVLPDLKMFADISMGDNQHLQSLILALGEAKAEGHLSGMEMKILRTTGFNPLVETARVTGESVESLTNKMADGKFSFEMLRKSMEYATSAGGRFNDMQKRMLETPGGKWMEAITNIAQAKEGLGESLLPAEGRFMDAVLPIIDALPGKLEELRPSIEHVMDGVTDVIKWSSNNTETIGRFFALAKTGVEAFAAWKLGTAALTAANWVFTASVGAATAENIASTAAIDAETAALMEQGAVLESLGLKWAAMGATEREAMLVASQGAFSLPTMGLSAAGMATSGAAGLTGGFAAGVSGTVLPVAVMYFAGEALNAFLPKDGDGHQMKWEQTLSFQGRAQMYDILFGNHPGVADMTKKNGHPSIGDAFDIYGYRPESENGSQYFPKAKFEKIGELLEAKSDEITGGGQKTVNITFRNFVENLYNQSANKGEGQAWTVRQLKTMLAELLSSIN